MLKAIILDFDGLIIDTEVVWYQLYKEWFFKEFNYNLSIENFLVCVGANVQELLTNLEQEADIQVDASQMKNILEDRFIHTSRELPIKIGVEKLIKDTKQNNLQLILATSASKRKPLYHLKRLGLLDYFDYILTAEDVDKIKPDPELFLLALDKCNISADEALIFEDSLNGVLAANRANIPVIVCPNEVTRYSSFTKYYQKVDSLLEIDLQYIIENFKQGAFSHVRN